MKDKFLTLLLTTVMFIDPEILIAEGGTLPIDNFSSVEDEADKYHSLLSDFFTHLGFKLDLD